MGKFNEIQKGLPDLGKTYWQDLKNQGKDDTTLPEIVEMNCQTIFHPENSLKNKPRTDIFYK